jgi:hypothetical protein
MDKGSLSKLTVPKLKELAKANGLSGYSALRKDALIELIVSRTGAKQKRASPTPEYSSFIDDCVATPRKDLVELADALEIDVDNKTKQQLCGELKQILEPSSPHKHAAPISSSFIDDCVATPRKDLIELADALEIDVDDKTKQQLCGELKQILEPPSTRKHAVSSISIDECMKKKKPELIELAIAAGIPSPSRKTKRVLCDELAGQSEKRASSPPSNLKECMKKLKPELVRLAKEAGIATAGKTKIDLCNELVSVQVGVAADLPSDEWISVADKLTNTHNAYMTPALLARQTTRQKLEREAKKRGINVIDRSKLELAQGIYDDTLKLPYAGVSEKVEAAISSAVSDPLVARDLIEAARDSIDPDRVAEAVESIVSETSLNRDEANQLVVDEIELEAAIPIIQTAEIEKTISTEEAVDALTELNKTSALGAREKVAQREVRSVETIEARLKELREPEAKVSELARVQTRVFQLLGLLH